MAHNKSLSQINLTPNFDLLNNNFDGYKLKSDPNAAVFTRHIEDGIFQNVSSDAPCYLFTRMESLHNHLCGDPFESNSVYLYNKKGHLLVYTFHDGYLGGPGVVWQEDFNSKWPVESTESPLFFSPSLSFPSSSFAVSSNGRGLLNILQTGDRHIGSSWVNLKETKARPGSIVSSLLIENSVEQKCKLEIHILLLSVSSLEDLKKNSLYSQRSGHICASNRASIHVLYWLTFGFDGDEWKLQRERHIVGSKSLEYASFDAKGEAVVLIAHDNFNLIYDSVIPVQASPEKIEEKEKDKVAYMFQQNNEEIKLWINAGTDTRKDEVHIDVKVREIKVKVRETVVLAKKFLHATDSFAATWKIEEGKIEICIPKAEENINWSSLFEGGDAEGEELLDESLAVEVHQRLAHLTSDQWNAAPDPDRPAFNPGQLEECDDASEDLFLFILDGTSHAVSNSSNLGAVQHLFNVNLDRNVIPSFCLRHDVDGLLWRLNEDRSAEHVATFHAFGYVKASKTMAKFTQSSPDNSYVAVADVNSHVYVFCQPDAFGGELRNRKSGKVSTTIARQLIISLKNHDEVMGIHCASNCVFIITNSDLFVYTLSSS